MKIKTYNMSDFKIAKLIFVEGRDGANSNKFYDMFEQSDGLFRAEYGRVDKTKTTKMYSMNEWNKTINSKIKKGYTDVSKLFVVVDKPKKDILDIFNISDSSVKNLMISLDSYSKNSVKQNYKISSDKVTLKMIDEAQLIIDNLVINIKIGGNKELINEKLLDLYKIIPRVMTRVSDYLISNDITKDNLIECEKMITREQATLDVMRGQVNMNTAQDSNLNSNSDIDILSIMGIEVELVSDNEKIIIIKQKMGGESSKFKCAYQIKNKNTYEKFNDFISKKDNKNTDLLWHGSRNENWLSIMQSGLILRPANAVITGKMFGWGTYFADKFKKSLGYSSYRGSYYANGKADCAYLALFKVHTGNQYHIKNWQSSHSSLTDAKLKMIGDYDSIYAHGGADLINNEYIVYNEDQTTIEYLVEIV